MTPAVIWITARCNLENKYVNHVRVKVLFIFDFEVYCLLHSSTHDSVLLLCVSQSPYHFTAAENKISVIHYNLY